jgi:hypothetical protein
MIFDLPITFQHHPGSSDRIPASSRIVRSHSRHTRDRPIRFQYDPDPYKFVVSRRRFRLHFPVSSRIVGQFSSNIVDHSITFQEDVLSSFIVLYGSVSSRGVLSGGVSGITI